MPSDVHVAATARQDRLLAATVLESFLGEYLGRRLAIVYVVPLFGALITWWVMLVKASTRTFRILRQEEQRWRARLISNADADGSQEDEP